MTGNKSERKGFVLYFSTDFAPHGGGIGFRVTGGQQQLRLVRLQPPRGFLSARPPYESPFREAFLR